MIFVRTALILLVISGFLAKPQATHQDNLVKKNEDVVRLEVKEINAKENVLPKILIISKINLRAEIDPVGLNWEGATDVPEENTRVSWYKLGAKPGERGSAVLAGHYQWTDGPGVFNRIPELEIGDEIITIDSQNKESLFLVKNTQVYDTGKFPLQEVYGNQEGHKLNLITCWGKYDQNKQDYLQRWVVYAEKRESE